MHKRNDVKIHNALHLWVDSGSKAFEGRSYSLPAGFHLFIHSTIFSIASFYLLKLYGYLLPIDKSSVFLRFIHWNFISRLFNKSINTCEKIIKRFQVQKSWTMCAISYYKRPKIFWDLPYGSYKSLWFRADKLISNFNLYIGFLLKYLFTVKQWKPR